MKKNLLALAVGAIGLLGAEQGRASFLYNGLLVPSFDGQPNTEYSGWDVFYTPYNNANYPDLAAPNGIYQSASSAGFPAPSNSSPPNPSAYFNVNNPTITQDGTNSAFIIGAGSAGNIYSFAAATSFTLRDTTPYSLGTVVFQFQTEGTMVDFSSIKLNYTDGTGSHSLSPNELLREYASSSSSFGGTGNRSAVQWDLTGLGITSYEVVFAAADSSMSFQLATLDTAQTFAEVVPASRTWSSGDGNWNAANGWSGQTYTSTNTNGNVNFRNAGAATIHLDGNHTVGQVLFDTAANTVIDSPGNFTLTANTGVTTSGSATGKYSINANYALGSYNIFEINSGTVAMNGVISGAYGLMKTGNGVLELNNNNTFNGTLAIEGGTLRIGGANTYTGATGVQWGTMIVAADAGSTGALGSTSTAIALGVDSTVFTTVPAGDAALLIEGDHTISRDVVLATGTFQKTLGATSTTGGATFSGGVNIGTSDNVKFTTSKVTDRVTFSGAITGGNTSLGVTISGPGTVVYSGSAKSYNSNTTVAAGTLVIAGGNSFTGNGAMTVNSGAKLVVDGTLGGSGGLALNGTLSGVGTVNRAVTTGGILSVLSAGDSPGTLTLASLNGSAGVSLVYELGTISDQINVNGLLAGSTGAGNMQFQFLAEPGAQAGVAYTLLTYGSASGLDLTDFALVNSAGFVLDTSFGSGGWLVSGNSVQVQFSAVPEPSTYALLISAIVVLTVAFRRREKFSK